LGEEPRESFQGQVDATRVLLRERRRDRTIARLCRIAAYGQKIDNAVSSHLT